MSDVLQMHKKEDEHDVREFLTFKLSKLHIRLNAQAVDLLHRHAGIGLAQWRILSLVHGTGVGSPVSLIAEIGMDKGQFSRTVRQLTEQGLVRVRIDRSDRRKQLIELTGMGRALVDRTLPIMRKRQAWLRASLEPDMLPILENAVARLEEAAGERQF